MNLSDYARMMSDISNKYEKYPKNLLTTHQIAIRDYNRLKVTVADRTFATHVDKGMEFSYKDYCVVYPQKPSDIKDEAVQQHNCVASYIKRVLGGECDIVFLRKKSNPDQSLVTVEVRDKYKIVQYRGKYNRWCSREEIDILKKYEEYLKDREGVKDGKSYVSITEY